MMRFGTAVVVFSLVLLLATGIAEAMDFVRLESVPRAATRPYGNLSIKALSDGRLLVWDGDTIYVQRFRDGDAFDAIATGYAGDTAFMDLAPDGHTAVLGAGLSGKLYRFDVNAPGNYSAASLIGTVSHYWGVFLTDTLVLIDKLADDWSTDELIIIDIAAPGLARKTIMRKPAASEIPPGGFAASAALTTDAAKTTVYTMALVFDSSFVVVANPLKRIPVSTLLNAYATDTILDWNTDASLIGSPTSFLSGGPPAVTANGDVLVVGFGGVQRVNPSTAAVTDTYAPGGPVYHGVCYDRATDSVIVLVTDPADYTMDLVYVPARTVHAVPVASGPGILGMIGVLLVLARRKMV
jgi:hypothetical protein